MKLRKFLWNFFFKNENGNEKFTLSSKCFSRTKKVKFKLYWNDDEKLNKLTRDI